jgi:2-phospho-L-lactate guanylyltransferase (CobY/MobA/RfbA family)
VSALGHEALIVDGPGGQGEEVLEALATLTGRITIVNGDVPCVTADELDELTRRAPALVAARDGTTNALSIPEPSAFAPLYGPGSAARFAAHLEAERLALPGLRDDVDTWDDLERIRDRVGRHTRAYLTRLERSQAS